MKLNHSRSAQALEPTAAIVDAIAGISEDYLRSIVETVAIPRHAIAEAANNRKIRDWVRSELESFGYRVEYQGKYDNVVALPRQGIEGPVVLVGAHYDSVPRTPGADDNASAVAGLLGCARALSRPTREAAVCFVAFNREEDGFLGSLDFVDNFVCTGKLQVKHAHILEMIGFASNEKGSQALPPMLPIQAPDTGNFLGILGNSASNYLVDEILSAGKTYLPEFPVIGLKLFLGAERMIPNMTRSDHVPFWAKAIPATMWTDTADFRNPNYHLPSDTPESLDYSFLTDVTKILLASLMSHDWKSPG